MGVFHADAPAISFLTTIIVITIDEEVSFRWYERASETYQMLTGGIRLGECMVLGCFQKSTYIFLFSWKRKRWSTSNVLYILVFTSISLHSRPITDFPPKTRYIGDGMAMYVLHCVCPVKDVADSLPIL